MLPPVKVIEVPSRSSERVATFCEEKKEEPLWGGEGKERGGEKVKECHSSTNSNNNNKRKNKRIKSRSNNTALLCNCDCLHAFI